MFNLERLFRVKPVKEMLFYGDDAFIPVKNQDYIDHYKGMKKANNKASTHSSGFRFFDIKDAINANGDMNANGVLVQNSNGDTLLSEFVDTIVGGGSTENSSTNDSSALGVKILLLIGLLYFFKRANY